MTVMTVFTAWFVPESSCLETSQFISFAGFMGISFIKQEILRDKYFVLSITWCEQLIPNYSVDSLIYSTTLVNAVSHEINEECHMHLNSYPHQYQYLLFLPLNLPNLINNCSAHSTYGLLCMTYMRVVIITYKMTHHFLPFWRIIRKMVRCYRILYIHGQNR